MNETLQCLKYVVLEGQRRAKPSYTAYSLAYNQLGSVAAIAIGNCLQENEDLTALK